MAGINLKRLWTSDSDVESRSRTVRANHILLHFHCYIKIMMLCEELIMQDMMRIFKTLLKHSFYFKSSLKLL